MATNHTPSFLLSTMMKVRHAIGIPNSQSKPGNLSLDDRKQQNGAIQGLYWHLRPSLTGLWASSEEEATPTNQNERPEETSCIPSIAPFSYFGRPHLNCLNGSLLWRQAALATAKPVPSWYDNMPSVVQSSSPDRPRRCPQSCKVILEVLPCSPQETECEVS